MEKKLDARKISASTEESEVALIAQAHKYRTKVVEEKPVNSRGLSNSTRNALISAILIPFGSFLASTSAIIFGHKAIKETSPGTRSRKVATTCLVIGYLTMAPVLLFVLARLGH